MMISTRIWMLATVASLANLMPLHAQDNHLEPVDGREGGWNHAWAVLASDPKAPRGLCQTAIFMQPGFGGASLVSILKTENGGSTLVYASFSEQPKPRATYDALPVTRVIKVFPSELAIVIGENCMRELLKTHYTKDIPIRWTDADFCVLGAHLEGKSFMMGQFTSPPNKNLEWIIQASKALSSFATASKEVDETKALEVLNQIILNRAKQ